MALAGDRVLRAVVRDEQGGQGLSQRFDMHARKYLRHIPLPLPREARFRRQK